MKRLLASAGCVLGLVLLAPGASGAPRLRAELAFDGQRAGEPLPVRVEVENDGPGGSFELSAFSRGEEVQPEVRGPLELASGARKTLWLLARTHRPELVVALRREGRIVAEQTLRVPEQAWSRPLVGILGAEPAGLRRGVGRGPNAQPAATFVSLEPEDLPPDPTAWPALDVLVWPGPVAHELEPRSAEALRAWLARGGRLVAGTNPEDPSALESLGLASTGGWGRVDRVEADLRRAPAARWASQLEFEREPPNARTHGPRALARRTLEDAEGLVRAPTGRAALLLGATLLGLGAIPVIRQHRARRGLPLTAGAVPLVAGLLALSATASAAIVHFAGEGSLVLVRIDVVDVDVATGGQRAESFLALRRAWGGPLTVEARGAARLTAPSGHQGMRPPSEQPLPLEFDLAGGRLTAEVGSWESLLVRARWSTDALDALSLPPSAEAAREALGAETAHLWQRGRRQVIGNDEQPSALLTARSFLSGILGPPTVTPLTGRLIDSLDEMAGDRHQWAWPVGLRWEEPSREKLLVAVTEASAAPQLWIDGAPAAPTRAWTLWRLRLPAEATP